MTKDTSSYYQISTAITREFHANSRRQRARQLSRLPMLVNFFAFLTGALVVAVRPTLAQVPVCDALTLYGNAVSEGLCKSLSPGTQNLWVCALTAGNPDIHTTFNANTALHLTVRENPAPPGCDRNSTLAGAWPNHVAIAPGQPQNICQVTVQNYVNRLNAVNRMPSAGGQTFCRTAFVAAGQRGKITHTVMQSYLNLCTQHACP
jgi:hypothetical protein